MKITDKLNSSKKTPIYIIITVLLSSCSLLEHLKPEVIDVTSEFNTTQEFDRLRYFKEINHQTTLKGKEITGAGVRITVMGEAVEVEHKDLEGKVINQYNTFVKKGTALRGELNKSYREDLLGINDGHGTHIAGTIAAKCDDKGIQGVACGSTLDVYDLGAYDSVENFPVEGWGKEMDVASRFLSAFTTAMEDVIKRGESKIVTGSFNLEAPVIFLKEGGPLQGLSIHEILKTIENEVGDLDDLLDKNFIELADPNDRVYLENIIKNTEEPMLPEGLVVSKSKDWSRLVDTISEYQSKDGVYLVTESNNDFNNRTSILNALPSLSDKIDIDLWLSVVLVMREEPEKGDYFSPINTCGLAAKDYCLVTPSYDVLSTMTERVAFWGDAPLLRIEDRVYQPLTGHSMGAPMVAGALALMQELNQKEQLGYTNKQLVKILKSAANRDFPGYHADKHGMGMLDIDSALRKMLD